MWFLAGVRMYVCVSDFQRLKPGWLINGLRYRYKILYTSEAITTLQSWLFSWQLMPYLWFYGILNFLKKGRVSSNFRKIGVIVLKLHTNILHPSRNFGIEFRQNRLKRSNFFRFWEFFQNCVTQANFDLSSWNFVRKCTNTEWFLILNFVKIGEVF